MVRAAGQVLLMNPTGCIDRPIFHTGGGGRSNMLKRVLGILFVVLLVCVVSGFAVRRYLTSQRVVNNVVAQLQTVYKGEIKLGGVDVGLGSTSLTKLELFEVDSAEKSPWLEISELNTDFSLFDYFQGNSLPGRIKISGAKILLRFSKDATLLTTLPDSLARGSWENADESGRFDAMPVIDLEKSQVTIRSEGSADLVFSNVNGKLDKNLEQLVLAGAMHNATWGNWTIAGLLHKHSAKISVQMKSQGSIHATQEMLERLPFVAEECWKEFRIRHMDTPVLVHLDYDLKGGDIHCRTELEPARRGSRCLPCRWRLPMLAPRWFSRTTR